MAPDDASLHQDIEVEALSEKLLREVRERRMAMKLIENLGEKLRAIPSEEWSAAARIVIAGSGEKRGSPVGFQAFTMVVANSKNV